MLPMQGRVLRIKRSLGVVKCRGFKSQRCERHAPEINDSKETKKKNVRGQAIDDHNDVWRGDRHPRCASCEQQDQNDDDENDDDDCDDDGNDADSESVRVDMMGVTNGNNDHSRAWTKVYNFVSYIKQSRNFPHPNIHVHVRTRALIYARTYSTATMITARTLNTATVIHTATTRSTLRRRGSTCGGRGR